MDTLPPEIVEKIFSYDDLLPVGLELSSEYYNTLSHPYYKQICGSTITEKELNNYLSNNNYPKFSMFVVQPKKHLAYSILYMPLQDTTKNTYLLVKDEINTSTGKVISKDREVTYRHYTLYPTQALDLYNYKNILSTRLSCVRLNPEYAHLYTLQLLDDTFATYLDIYHMDETYGNSVAVLYYVLSIWYVLIPEKEVLEYQHASATMEENITRATDIITHIRKLL